MCPHLKWRIEGAIKAIWNVFKRCEEEEGDEEQEQEEDCEFYW